ncbi:MAG: hypothetical protein JST67_05745 [Bacteroidetes bacterium]|nr:hypothetical protein [Bacteroidota bacterium]
MKKTLQMIALFFIMLAKVQANEDTVVVKLSKGITYRGFTGHEHLQNFDLINMNGRVYDSKLGLFLSIDPLMDKTPGISPYHYANNNPLKFTDITGNYEDNYLIHEDGAVGVERTKDLTNTYTYVKHDGTKVDLGTYKVNKKGMIELPQKTSFFAHQLFYQGTNFLPEDGAASFLGATYSYFEKTGYVSKVNQLMNEEGVHSPNNTNQKNPGKPSKKTLVDVQYIGKERVPYSVQSDTRNDNADAVKSAEYANYFRKFGFNNEGIWNVITLNKDGNAPFIPNSSATFPHQNHMHFQALIKAIEITK